MYHISTYIANLISWISDPGLDLDGKFENAGFKGAVALKTQHPHLKVTIAIGGWNEGSLKFSNMAASATSRATFVQSVVDFLELVLVLKNYFLLKQKLGIY